MREASASASEPVWRYERKMLPARVDPEWVAHRIRLHPAGFAEVYPPREVNNLYLDTLGRADFHQHTRGVAARSKTRVRWYGPLDAVIERANLEFKIKRGVVGRKEAYPVAGFALNHVADAAALHAALKPARMPGAARAALDLRRPSLVNRYARRYYLSADGLVRLTLDTNLRYYDPRDTTRPLGHPSRGGQAVVVELKYDPDHAERAAAIANRLPFRMARCSKYVEGVRRMLGVSA